MRSKICVLLFCIICGVVFTGCQAMGPSQVAKGAPIGAGMVSPGKTAEPLPTQKPSPTPKPTPKEVPFHELAPTTVMGFEELVGDNGDYSDPPPPPEAGTYKVVINIYHQFVTVYEKGAEGSYTVPVRYMICTSGSYKNPTPTGTFKMGSDRKRFACFTKYRVYGQYWGQITRNIYFHSILYAARNARYYTDNSYRMLGTRASHGCVRLLVPDARWIYYNIAPGTEIEIIQGSENDEQAKAIRELLVRAPIPQTRPDLEPGGFAITEAWPGYNGPVASLH